MLEWMNFEIGEPGRRAELCRVAGARGLVMFVHADGDAQSSRRSAEIAQRLQQREFSTLLLDLLTPDEAHDPVKVHDIDLLTERVLQALDALPPALREEPLGLFGADTGAAAALVLATRRPQAVHAVVARGGQPDLAGPQTLAAVRAATLLIVGAADAEGVAINRQAFAQLGCAHKRIELVARATQLFREAGTLDTVARCAADWFAAHMPQR